MDAPRKAGQGGGVSNWGKSTRIWSVVVQVCNEKRIYKNDVRLRAGRHHFVCPHSKTVFTRTTDDTACKAPPASLGLQSTNRKLLKKNCGIPPQYVWKVPFTTAYPLRVLI